MKSTIAFAGTVEKLTCKCHEGQFGVVAWLLRKGQDDQFVQAHGPYKTEDEAVKALHPFVEKCAQKILKETGLIDTVTKAEEIVGDAANVRAELFKRSEDQTIH